MRRSVCRVALRAVAILAISGGSLLGGAGQAVAGTRPAGPFAVTACSANTSQVIDSSGGTVSAWYTKTTAPSSVCTYDRYYFVPKNGAAIASPAPVAPTALAVDAQGALYIADPVRNEIIERTRAGTFTRVAGTGRAGFSPLQHIASQAELNDPAGMAFANDGILYFADTRNNRVRAVLPNGRIVTIAGNGQAGEVTNGEAALRAPLDAPTDVAVHDGVLYIAATGSNEVLRLSDGRLFLVAGSPSLKGSGLIGEGGPAVNASPDGPTSLAFDSEGDLFLMGSNTKALLVITPSGAMRVLARGVGVDGPAQLATGPNGTVIGSDGQSVVRLNSTAVAPWMSFTRLAVPVDGRSFKPSGLTVTHAGTVLLDSDGRNGYSNRAVIIAVMPPSKVSLVWSAPRHSKGTPRWGVSWATVTKRR